jgi:polyhydroxyalkanoate synthesis regulator phasin
VRPLLVTVAVLAIAAPLVAGCGGGSSSSTTSSTNGTGTSATEWAGGFCSAFSTWASALEPIGQDLQSNPTKKNLQSSADKIRSANDELANDLGSLGKPDLPRAQEAKNVVDDLADQIKKDSDTISQALSNTSTVSEIVQAAATISTSLVNLQTQVQDAVLQLNSIDKTDSLKNAFNDASACKALQSSS